MYYCHVLLLLFVCFQPDKSMDDDYFKVKLKKMSPDVPDLEQFFDVPQWLACKSHYGYAALGDQRRYYDYTAWSGQLHLYGCASLSGQRSHHGYISLNGLAITMVLPLWPVKSCNTYVYHMYNKRVHMYSNNEVDICIYALFSSWFFGVFFFEVRLLQPTLHFIHLCELTFTHIIHMNCNQYASSWSPIGGTCKWKESITNTKTHSNLSYAYFKVSRFSCFHHSFFFKTCAYTHTYASRGSHTLAVSTLYIFLLSFLH